MKIITPFILLILFSTSIFSQRFNAGFLAGMAATQVDGDGHGGYNKAGPIVGIWVSTRFNSTVFLRSEFRYIQKGSFAKSSDGIEYYRMRLNYFEMPYLLGYRFNNGFNGFIGLSAGYLAKAREMNELGDYPSDEIAEFKKFEFAGLLGVEYNYSERWKIGALFCYSILPIRPHEGNVIWRWNRGQYNQVLELVVRYVL